MKSKLFSPGFLSLALALITLSASCRKDGVTSQQSSATKSSAINVKAKVNAVPATETLQTAGNGTFYIINRKSGKMLDVSGYATADGSNVVQYSATGGTNQRWTLTQLTGGYYSVVGVHSGKGLQVAGASTTDGADVNISTYTGTNNQQWEFISIGGGYYRIVNRNSGKDLDVVGQSADNSAEIDQWGYWGGENQQWALITTNAGGQLTWTLTSTGVPADVQTRITNAMNDACARYNALANWSARTLTVQYNTGVATADANAAGNIRFGPNASYQNTRTAMHEIAHTWGVGTTATWNTKTSSGQFTGTNALDVIRTYDGPSATISAGGSHFWPYGLNYDSEWSEANAYRHVKIVFAMRADGIL